MTATATKVDPSRTDSPERLKRIGGKTAPPLSYIGDLRIIDQPMVALFCSNGCPGEIILKTYEQAAQWRDAGQCIISGFHSPVEKECLRILLRGAQPIIICPGRCLEGLRIRPDWQPHIEPGRLLLISPFPPTCRRAGKAVAHARHEFVAALADEVHVAYAEPGSSLCRFVGTGDTPLLVDWASRAGSRGRGSRPSGTEC
jgi:predicted Rossmann fold nucleotide-binding protein DprA/Smf involved in DNA uptake